MHSIHVSNRLFTVFVLFLSVALPQAHAANSATATVGATIVTPISVTTAANLAFGNISAGTGGTVVVSPGGVRSKTGGVTLVNSSGTVTAARFNVTGLANATYTITMPASVTITSGANSMTVGTFTSTPSPTGTLSGTGTQTVAVGATLTVASAQVPAAYTGSFTFTVDYN